MKKLKVTWGIQSCHCLLWWYKFEKCGRGGQTGFNFLPSPQPLCSVWMGRINGFFQEGEGLVPPLLNRPRHSHPSQHFSKSFFSLPAPPPPSFAVLSIQAFSQNHHQSTQTDLSQMPTHPPPSHPSMKNLLYAWIALLPHRRIHSDIFESACELLELKVTLEQWPHSIPSHPPPHTPYPCTKTHHTKIGELTHTCSDLLFGFYLFLVTGSSVCLLHRVHAALQETSLSSPPSEMNVTMLHLHLGDLMNIWSEMDALNTGTFQLEYRDLFEELPGELRPLPNKTLTKVLFLDIPQSSNSYSNIHKRGSWSN